MPKVSKDGATGGGEFGPVTDRSDQIDDRCQCPHWGYVISGRMTFRYADGEEVFEAGDAFYTPPGHTPLVEAGTEIVQFSPADELRTTEAAMMKNMQEMQGG
jgi:hypothetical protein